MAKTLWTSGHDATTQVGRDVTVYLCCAQAGLTLQTSGNEDRAQITQRTAGTLASMYVTVSFNSLDETDSIFRVRKNGADGSLLITVPAATTGAFSDNTNADAIADGDTLNYQIIGGHSELASKNIKFGLISTTFAASSNSVIRYAAVNFPDLSGWGTSTFYFGMCELVDPSGPNTNEAYVRFDTNAAATYKNMYVSVSANINPDGAEVYLNQNGGNTAVFVAIPATTTGVFEDQFSVTGNAVTTSANDDMNYQFTFLGSNTDRITPEVISIEATSTDKTSHSINCRVGLGNVGPALTRYFVCGGGGTFNATETYLRNLMNMSATTSNLTVYVATDTIA